MAVAPLVVEQAARLGARECIAVIRRGRLLSSPRLPPCPVISDLIALIDRVYNPLGLGIDRGGNGPCAPPPTPLHSRYGENLVHIRPLNGVDWLVDALADGAMYVRGICDTVIIGSRSRQRSNSAIQVAQARRSCGAGGHPLDTCPGPTPLVKSWLFLAGGPGRRGAGPGPTDPGHVVG